MKVLFIGDIVGNVGRQMIEDYLYRIRKDYQIDFVIANVENATHGKGLNRKHYDFFTFEGVDCMTMGNHTFDKKNFLILLMKLIALLFLSINQVFYQESIQEYLMLKVQK